MAAPVQSSGKMFDNFSVLGRRNTVLACLGGYVGIYLVVKMLKPSPAPAAAN
eukprot:m.411368 g.411368  ORF g.411368 m.411368 type:complete len:52 (+) comp28643_c0_seq1:249-404(+)